jgi:probable addiction module antidote protein
MSKSKTKPFDPAEYLDDGEAIAGYMSEALESGDPAFVADALGVVARARGMSEVAREASRVKAFTALYGRMETRSSQLFCAWCEHWDYSFLRLRRDVSILIGQWIQLKARGCARNPLEPGFCWPLLGPTCCGDRGERGDAF